MKFSNVKEKHIYNVIFDPVEPCEFDKKHLALVLKKNNDKKTCIVVPLTSEDNGDGVNKINIGYISTLPTSLKCNNTYAVINQVRTVNVSRFIALKEVIGGVNTPIGIVNITLCLQYLHKSEVYIESLCRLLVDLEHNLTYFSI